MDTLTCRSPSRCATCAHWDARAGCELERELDVVLASLEARPRTKQQPLLMIVDARRLEPAAA